MCGIVGVVAHEEPVNQAIFDALTVMQHRGQDAAGIMTANHDRLNLHKGVGLVRDVIRQTHMLHLEGSMGMGHVRYPTAGTDNPNEAQPFYVNSPYGLGLVHNGNLTNAAELTDTIIKADLRHLNTASDSEVLLNVVAYELQRVAGPHLTPAALCQAMQAVYSRIRGAFAAILMIHHHGMLAFRDPHGIRPLIYGRRLNKKNQAYEYMVASESIALDALGFEIMADVAPAEAVFFTTDGAVHRFQCAPAALHSPCMFEYIYLARPDSVIDNISVYQARVGMGVRLADKISKLYPDSDIDVVIPVPDTSRIAAVALAKRLGLYYSEGIVKNRYIGRTFIMPGQALRRSSVRLKLNAIRQEIVGKNVLLVDDSIVRGTTSQEIIQMVRNAGAKKVYFASAAPQIRFPNVYGIDLPTSAELVAYDKTDAEIAALIHADGLIYQDLEDVVAAINEAALSPEAKILRFEDAVFTGEYVSGTVDADFLSQWEMVRSRQDNAK